MARLWSINTGKDFGETFFVDQGLRRKSWIDVVPKALQEAVQSSPIGQVGEFSQSNFAEFPDRFEFGMVHNARQVLASSGASVGVGTTAAKTSSNASTFNLAGGFDLTISVDGGPDQSIVFVDGDFSNASAATALEVDAAINKQIVGAIASGSTNVVLTTQQAGGAGSIQVTGGSAAAVIGYDTDIVEGTESPLKGGDRTGTSKRIVPTQFSASGILNTTETLLVVDDGIGGLSGDDQLVTPTVTATGTIDYITGEIALTLSGGTLNGDFLAVYKFFRVLELADPIRAAEGSEFGISDLEA